MKKYLFVFILMFVSLPLFTSAQVSGNTQSSTHPCLSFTPNLFYSSRDTSTGGAVTLLQNFLKAQGYFHVDPTGFFGLQTQAAARLFQGANNILTSGYVGPITRARINILTCGGLISPSSPPATITTTPSNAGTPITPQAPAINYLSPNFGPVGTQVIIYGSNFSSNQNGNTVLFDGVNAGYATILNSNSGSVTLSYTIPQYQPLSCPQSSGNTYTSCDPIPQLALGNHTIAIQTSSGSSNPVTFTVDTLPPPPVNQPMIGTLQGKATAIPFCPNGVSPCQTSASTYMSFGILVYQNGAQVQHVKLNGDGTYSLTLSSGIYTIYPDNQPPGTATGDSWKSDLPQQVTIQTGATTTLTLTIHYTQY